MTTPPENRHAVQPPELPVRVSPRVTLAWAVVGVCATVYYLEWLTVEARVGVVALFALLVAADLFNGFHALSFWATCLRRPKVRAFESALATSRTRVDVLVPTYNEPVAIVEPTLLAALAMTGPAVRVFLLDDGTRTEMRELAARLGVHYVVREQHTGAKSGNINHALAQTMAGGAELIAIFDCDHAPRPEFLERTVGFFADPGLAMVQTPQVYGNREAGPLTAGSSQQQEIFFGPICQGRDGFDSAFCCGTNFVARRSALQEAGGFPEDSITEDIVLSTTLVGLGWEISYLNEPLTAGLGPEDAKSYVAQQLRWATGCIDLLLKRPHIWRPLSWVQRWQYFVATSYWLTGWTILIYLSMPVATLVFGAKPLRADGLEFVQHFLPYFLISIVNLGRFTIGNYGISGLGMNWGSFPVHIRATLRVITGRTGGFTVTSKEALAGSAWWPFRANVLVAVGLLVAIAIGFARTGLTAATVNNAAFAALNGTLVVLIVGLATVQARRGRSRAARSRGPALAATATVLVWLVAILGGCGGSPAAVGAGSTAPARDEQLARESGRAFLDRYVDGDGRVVRRDQDGDTVSEGQSYGMLIAVAIGDRARFDAIWGWARRELQRSDSLLSFQWRWGKVTDPLPATDADLDAARALLIAADRWGDPAYRDEALAIGRSILDQETVDVGGRRMLVAGPWARAAPAVVNPSYFNPRAYDALLAASGDPRWRELQDTGLETINGLTTNAPSLPPDWARVHGTEVVPSYQPGFAIKGVRYSYEATRVVLRYAESCPAAGPDPDAVAPAIGRRVIARAWPFLKAQGPDGPVIGYRADGRALGSNRHPLAAVAAAAAADAAGDVGARDRLFAVSERSPDLNYYGGAWNALGRIMLTTDWLGRCGTPGGVG